MKFAEIGYIKEDEKLWVSDFVLKLPKWLRIKYFLCFVPLKVEETEIAHEKGIKITLPITSKEDNYGLCIRMIKKTAALLMEKKIKIVINEDRIPMPYGLVEARGSIPISYFASRLVKDACETNNIELSEAKVVVIDGKNLETFLVLNSLLGEVNHLAVRTDEKERLEDTANTIFEESGLVTEFFVSPRGDHMKEADIIINCNDDMENFDYVFKKGAVYIESSAFRGKINRLRVRRSDMKFVTNIFTNVKDERLDAAHTEALFLVKCADIEKGLTNCSDDDKMYEALDILESLYF